MEASNQVVVPWRCCAVLPDGSGLSRPIVPVELTAPGGVTVETNALVDSGADQAMAHLGLLGRLGIAQGDCAAHLEFVNGSPTPTYFHPVTLTIAERWTVRLTLRFRAWDLLDAAAREGTALVVGSQDVLQCLRVTFDGDVTILESRQPGLTEFSMPHAELEAA